MIRGASDFRGRTVPGDGKARVEGCEEVQKSRNCEATVLENSFTWKLKSPT